MQFKLVTQDRISDLKNRAQEVLAQARHQGATQAEVILSKSHGFNTSIRNQAVETLEFTQDKILNVVVYVGQQKGSASTSDLSKIAIDRCLEAALGFARAAEPDPCAGLADPASLAQHFPNLELDHPVVFETTELIDFIKTAEEAAFSVDPRITNTEGTELSLSRSLRIYGNTEQFIASHVQTGYSLSATMLAKDDKGHMQRDYEYSVHRDWRQLMDPKTLGRRAAERTLQRLSPQRLKTQNGPVIFSADMAKTLLGHLVAALSGKALYRKSSFLLNSLGESIFPADVDVWEDPYLKSGLGSKAFDQEGVQTQKKSIIASGSVASYLLGSYSARKLGLKTTGNAGGVHNLHIRSNSDVTFSELLKRLDRGLLITELMGQGVNPVTGDYSQGANGFWVEQGSIQYPVEGITIASNLRTMFKNLAHIANDVDVRSNIRTGSWLISDMMIGGL